MTRPDTSLLGENWKLLTVTHGGTVSLLKGLSKEKALELQQSLLHWAYRNDSCKPGGCISYTLSKGDIIRTEAFE